MSNTEDVVTSSQREFLILDAMGVIFQAGDDVAELLVPFVREKGGSVDAERIETAYREASLGHIDAAEFWRQMELPRNLEDEYLRRHTLTEGLLEMLKQAPDYFLGVYCLSNDLSDWSRKLRHMYQLVPYFAGWYISGDLGLRKPDPKIYVHLLRDLDVHPSRVIFVDDRAKNLDAAAELGIQTVLFDFNRTGAVSGHRTIDRLTSLLEN